MKRINSRILEVAIKKSDGTIPQALDVSGTKGGALYFNRVTYRD